MKTLRTSNFRYNELIYSDTAIINNIDNNAPEEYKENCIKLMLFLQELRDAFGKTIIINSGYRSKELNKLVGGSPISSHLYFLAADIRTGNIDELIDFIKDFYKDRDDYDQIIIESNGRSKWVHIGIEHPKYGKRGQLFNMNV